MRKGGGLELIFVMFSATLITAEWLSIKIKKQLHIESVHRVVQLLRHFWDKSKEDYDNNLYTSFANQLAHIGRPSG